MDISVRQSRFTFLSSEKKFSGAATLASTAMSTASRRDPSVMSVVGLMVRVSVLLSGIFSFFARRAHLASI